MRAEPWEHLGLAIIGAYLGKKMDEFNEFQRQSIIEKLEANGRSARLFKDYQDGNL